MTSYKPRQIKDYKAGMTYISARDLNDLRDRIRRLEGLKAVPPLRVHLGSPSTMGIMLTHDVSECILVQIKNTPNGEGVKAGRNYLYDSYPIELNKNGSYYGEGSSVIWDYQTNLNKRYRFRNVFLFIANDDDWAFIARMPQLEDDYILLQVMCPGAIVDTDAPEFTEYPPTPEPGPGGTEFPDRFRLPVPLIPGILDV